MPRKKTIAADATTFAITATVMDRPTKTKKFKLGDWAHVPGMVRACWPDEGKVTLSCRTASATPSTKTGLRRRPRSPRCWTSAWAADMGLGGWGAATSAARAGA